MAAYFIAQLNIRDRDEFRKYSEALIPVFKKYSGKYLAVDDAPELLEGSWEYSRLVLIEFPDRQSLKDWYYSPEYQEVMKIRLGAADADVIIADKTS
jgi:uncharacterized protein (DUF1330 family)